MPESAQTHPDRRLNFEGATNFRDLGGYQTSDGRTLRWGQLYRSDSLAELSPSDVGQLAGMELQTIIDFRSRDEQLNKPNRLPDPLETMVVHLGFLPDGTRELLDVVKDGSADAADIRKRIIHNYRGLALNYSIFYRKFFAHLLEADSYPLVFHCTSGKDRTGFVAALVLLALGVPEDTIFADYQLSSQYRTDITHLVHSGVDPSVMQALTSADETFLRSAFNAISDTFDSTDAFLEQALGLTFAKRDKLKSILLS